MSNPDGIVADIEAIAAIAHTHGLPLVVDNTLPTPYLCQPLQWGADIVVHSMTKYLGGQGNSVGGAIVEGGRFDWANGKFPLLAEPTEAYHGLRFFETFGNFAFALRSKAIGLRDMGPALSPFNAFLILQGIETLPLRMDRHVANADQVAAWLASNPHVSWVSYPRLPQNRTPLLEKYCPRGLGSVFTIGVKGGYEMGVRLVDNCQLLSHVANIGDTRSLIIHPASTTHRQLDADQLVAAGAGPEVVRLSIGIETAEDIIADLEQALARRRRRLERVQRLRTQAVDVAAVAGDQHQPVNLGRRRQQPVDDRHRADGGHTAPAVGDLAVDRQDAAGEADDDIGERSSQLDRAAHVLVALEVDAFQRRRSQQGLEVERRGRREPLAQQRSRLGLARRIGQRAHDATSSRRPETLRDSKATRGIPAA